MGKMKLYELVNKYHIGTELTCAEAMFMACNEYYHLNLSEETRKMFSLVFLLLAVSPYPTGIKISSMTLSIHLYHMMS